MAAELGDRPAGAEAEGGPTADDAVDAALDAAETILAQPEVASALTADELADILELVFELVALRRGDHWRLEPREKARIAKWLHKSAERHGGLEWLARYAPDIITGALLAGAVYRRVKVDRAALPAGS
jgi:hypothetical protein